MQFKNYVHINSKENIFHFVSTEEKGGIFNSILDKQRNVVVVKQDPFLKE